MLGWIQLLGGVVLFLRFDDTLQAHCEGYTAKTICDLVICNNEFSFDLSRILFEEYCSTLVDWYVYLDTDSKGCTLAWNDCIRLYTSNKKW
jgi:hypothetical protein